MTMINFVLGAALGSLAVPIPVAYAQNSATPATVISGNGDLDISTAQLVTLQNDALHGSGAAAKKLSGYYYYVKLDRESGIYWDTIGAEDGNSKSMLSLGLRMTMEKKDHQTDIRARYWLERAKAAGEANANSILEELNIEGR